MMFLDTGKTQRIYYTSERFRRARATFQKRGVYMIVGTSSFYIPTLKAKAINLDLTQDWPDLDGWLMPMTSGEAARTELKREFPDLKRTGWPGKAKSLFGKTMPMYCLETGTFEGAYVDLVAAYWQIYRNLSLDGPYPRGLGRLSLRYVAGRLQDWKGARNALVGITRSLSTSAIKGNRRITLFPDNPFLSPYLWANIQETLHCLGRIAILCDAVYCMTDGYLFKNQKSARTFLNYLKEMDIDYRVFWGKIDIKGWTSYLAPGRGATMMYKEGKIGGRRFRNLSTEIDNPFKMVDFTFKMARRYTDERNGF